MNRIEILDIKTEVVEWASNVVRLWEARMTSMNIGDKGRLMRSFKQFVEWHAAGDRQKIEFTFEYYGKFVDWGVGGGVTLDNRQAMISNGLTRRRAKPWYTDTFYKQIARLNHIVAEATGRDIRLFIVQNIDDNSNLHVGKIAKSIK